MNVKRSRLKKRTSSRSISLYRTGEQAGLNAGWEDGYWLGQCEAIMQRTAYSPAVRPLHILYVATGKGYPYSPLDEAIAATLRTMAARLDVTDAKQPVAAIAAQLRPDLVLVLDGLQLDVQQVDQMREYGIRTAIWFTDDPYYSDLSARIAPHYNDVFTLELTCVPYYKNLGCASVHYLPLAVNPADFRPRHVRRAGMRDIVFIGTGYWPRIAFFNQTVDYLARRNSLISGMWWERLEQYGKLADRIDLGKWMGPIETSLSYNNAKIVINMHRSPHDETFNQNSQGITAVSPNPRTFEINGCAVLQLVDERSDLASHYALNQEIVTYSSPADLIEKVDYYLANEQERQRIALRGLYRTMRDHTYARRIETIFALLFGM